MNRPKPPWVYRAVVGVLRPLMRLITRPRRWSGGDHLPPGPFIIVANHISSFDPFTLIHYLADHGVYAGVMAKASLWRYPVVGWVMRQVHAIPVYRGSAAAKDALDDGAAALTAGYAVLLFPEGTTTQDPGIWPMKAKSGAARLALRTGATVIPIAQWGAHRVISTFGPGVHFRAFPPKPSEVVAGPPVDLSDLLDRPDDPAAWDEATARMMARITEQLATIRGEEPPAEPFVRRPHTGPPD